jgi:hypothetical protein
MRALTHSDRPAAPVPASDTQSPNTQRRRFLLAFGASGAGAVAAAAGTIPVVAAAQAAAAAQTESDDGYRETTRVRDYYRTTRL